MQDGGVSNSGALPYLQRMMQFSWQRNTLLSDAAANLDPPGYQPVDVPVAEFQGAMKAAQLREEGIGSGILPPVTRGHGAFGDTDGIRFEGDGIRLAPDPARQNLTFHDGNDRNLERIMQNLAENALAFRLASELFRKEHDILRSAIRERP